MSLDPPLRAAARDCVAVPDVRAAAWWQPLTDDRDRRGWGEGAIAGPTREGDDSTGRLLAAVNFTTVPVTLGPPAGLSRRATLLTSTDPDRVSGDADLARLVLLPSEAVLLLVPPEE